MSTHLHEIEQGMRVVRRSASDRRRNVSCFGYVVSVNERYAEVRWDTTLNTRVEALRLMPADQLPKGEVPA